MAMRHASVLLMAFFGSTAANTPARRLNLADCTEENCDYNLYGTCMELYECDEESDSSYAGMSCDAGSSCKWLDGTLRCMYCLPSGGAYSGTYSGDFAAAYDYLFTTTTTTTTQDSGNSDAMYALLVLALVLPAIAAAAWIVKRHVASASVLAADSSQPAQVPAKQAWGPGAAEPQEAVVAVPIQAEVVAVPIKVQQSSSLWCPSCGAKNQQGHRFCNSCGAELQAMEAVNVPPPTEPADAPPPTETFSGKS